MQLCRRSSVHCNTGLHCNMKELDHGTLRQPLPCIACHTCLSLLLCLSQRQAESTHIQAGHFRTGCLVYNNADLHTIGHMAL
jgi:hypothetical protein